MQNLRNKLMALAALAVLAVVGSLMNPHRAIAQAAPPNGTSGSAPVTIVSPIPLPVSGSVGVSGAVTIANAATSPVLVRDVDESAREPFQMGIVPHEFSNGGTDIAILTVPSNKRLVIEHISAEVNVFTASGLSTVSLIKDGFTHEDDHLVCANSGNATLNHFFACSAQTKYYVAPGQSIKFAVFTADSGSGGFFHGFISGYYVPVP